MLYHKKLAAVILLFVSYESYASQTNDTKIVQQPHVKLADQLASYKALEKKTSPSAPLYFFHDQDLDGPTELPKKPTTKSLYAAYNDLVTPLQDYITSFLVKMRWSDEKDSQTGALKVIEDEEWKKNCKKRFKKILSSQESISFKETEFIKNLLRIEYWLRFVKRARNEHTMINNRMEPSALVSEEPYYFMNRFLNGVYFFATAFPGDIDIELIGLIISCGVLVNQKKDSCSLLVSAIRNDDAAMIKLLRHARLTQPYGSASLYSERSEMHVAADYGAVQAIQYFYDRGCDIDAQDRDGRVPLHRAYDFGHPQAANLLKSLGANQDIPYKSLTTYDRPCWI